MLYNLAEIKNIEIKNRILKEYLNFKTENMDFVLLFQIGDFFEIFFEDAKIFSNITSVTLSSRPFKDVGEILQAGFPKSALNLYIKKLLNANYKVCICEQFKDENGIAFRELTRKYTKGTILEDDFLESSENNYIASLYLENDTCYFSYADVSTGQFYKTSSSFEKIFFEVEKIAPCEILIPKKQDEFFSKKLSEYFITLFDDEFFSSDSIENSILNYCIETQRRYAVKLDKIVEYKIETFMFLDEITRRNLELTRTKSNLKKKGSIYWFLNTTKTSMGARLLKKCIAEPLINLNEIYERQSAVDELIQNQNLLEKLECNLDNFCDISRICAKISNSTINPKELSRMTKNILFLKDTKKICDKFTSSLLKIDYKKMSEVIKYINDVQLALKDDAPCELKSGGIIKEGYNSELDFLKDKLKSSIKKLETYAKKEAKRLEIEELALMYSRTLGYYFEIPVNKRNHMGANYICKHSVNKVARYTNEKVQEFEQDIFNLTYRINEMEYELFLELRKRMLVCVELIRDVAKDIARIDVFATFARCALDNGFSKPKFNKTKISIIKGYHPSLIRLGNQVVKNDTILKNHSSIVLTGANMSGKSTYLKHNAIIALFSQIGAYVPAESANMTLVDKIFLRQGASDDIINNNSSFMVEMNDLKFILENATKDSLVLLDEPAKSTSEIEGGAIARAFLEYLTDNVRAKTIVATHNFELTKIESINPNVTNYVMGLNEDDRIMDRKIQRGVANSSQAVNTAILALLPTEIITRAKQIISNFGYFNSI